MIDGARLDYSSKSKIFNSLKQSSVYFSQPITYGPHTIAAMHAVFSGTYGTKTGTNSYWSTYQFKKDKFKEFYINKVVNLLLIIKKGRINLPFSIQNFYQR